MTKSQRRRRAAIGAMAVLEWRDQMRRENAARDNAELEVLMRFETMIAEMKAEAERFRKLRAEHRAICKLATVAVHGTGHAGAL